MSPPETPTPPPDSSKLTLVGAGKKPRQQNPPGTGTLGVWIMLASLSVLFAASMVGYLVVRLQAPQWPPAGAPGLPASLWISTAVILACSVTIHRALRAAERDDQARLRRLLITTFVLGCLFLVLQSVNWWELMAQNLSAASNLYGFTFYILTGLHAAHVIGGLIPLGIVTRRASAGRYSSFFHGGVRHTGMYWHFLDAVWIIIFVTLLIGS